VRDFLRKLSPTRSPVLAMIVFVVGVPFWLVSARLWARLLGLDLGAAVNTAVVGASATFLTAIVLYGLTPRFRTSTSRLGVRLPRCVLVLYWIVAWVVSMLQLVASARPLPLVVQAGEAVLGLVALVLLVIGFVSPDDVAHRRLRAGAPPLYRALAWASLLSGTYLMRALKNHSLTPAKGWAFLLACAVVFFLAYALDERWYRRQLPVAEEEPALSEQQEEAPASR